MAHEIKEVDSIEEEYDENADEDFNPDEVAADEDGALSSSGEEDNGSKTKTTVKFQKRKVDNIGELDSGDEATIRELGKKRKKEKVEDDSGGEGGLVKTRAQRLAEKVEKKQRKQARDGQVTIDVDQLWVELKSVPIGRHAPVPSDADAGSGVPHEQNKENEAETAHSPEKMVTIRKTIEFAGEITEVEEQVPKTSKEAQRYLAEHPEADPDYKPPTSTLDGNAIQRPLKRPSIFEPNPTALVKGVPAEKLRPRAPSRLDVLMAEKRAQEEQRKKAEKMSTVQKSALDWKGFVDQEQGLRDELDEYGKSKRGYLAREDFLGRAQIARDTAARDARLKG